MLEVGDKAPEFTAPADGGGQVKLKDLRGQKVILYFYPKDNTPGCTKEACDRPSAQRPAFSAGRREMEPE